MTSRRITPTELQDLRGRGDLTSRASEHVLALDAVSVIANPDAGLSTLSIGQLRDVFTCRTTDWSQLGAPAGPIRVLARDDRSGTFGSFRDAVLGGTPGALPAHPAPVPVPADAARRRRARAGLRRAVRALGRGPADRRRGRVRQPAVPAVPARTAAVRGVGPRLLRARRRGGARPFDIRFASGTDVPDNRAFRNIMLFGDLMATGANRGREVLLVGFADNAGTDDANLSLSRSGRRRCCGS